MLQNNDTERPFFRLWSTYSAISRMIDELDSIPDSELLGLETANNELLSKLMELKTRILIAKQSVPA